MSESERRLPVVGDYVEFWFGGPGPDITAAKVVGQAPDGQLVCYDPFFRIEFTAKPISKPDYGGVYLLLEPEKFIANEDGVVMNVIEKMEASAYGRKN